MVVLLTKGNLGFRGIGLVEVLRKALLGVVNWRISGTVQFHNMLHGFKVDQVVGTVSLESKLLQKLTEMSKEVL